MVLDNTRVNKTIRGGGTTRRWFGQRIGVRYPWGWHQSGSFSARRRFGGLMDCVVMCLDRGVGVGSFEWDGRMVLFMDPVGACRSLYYVF